MRTLAIAWILGSLGVCASSNVLPQGASAAEEHTIAALPKSCYFVVPAQQPPPAGRRGGLVVVLPGGTGGREFLPWVESVLLRQAPSDCLGVMLTAVQWNDRQKTVWCQTKQDAPEMQYSTEEYVRAVVAAIEAKHAIDPARRVVVAWSSSGVAVQPLVAKKDSPFRRAYVAMSDWPRGLDLSAVKGRRYVLDQSPDDQQTAFSQCRRAFAELTKAGAMVRLETYAGGHGWKDDPERRLREGLRWLFSDEAAPKPKWPPGKPVSTATKRHNLLVNGGFEDGLEGWNQVANSGRLVVAATPDGAKEGRQALQLRKTGGLPLDLVRQETELPAGSRVVVSAFVKSRGATGAAIKVWLHDDEDRVVAKDVDLVQLTADTEWRRVERDWPAKNATRAVLQIVLPETGELWVDQVVLAVVK